uniref:TRAP transporter small permease n=1 Tax=Ndongobacter massiliensis TaxID=1871025 RepID=UPI000930A1CE|nr:TRAP transporter small permease subunit [Ndongobacter massiliensis]
MKKYVHFCKQFNKIMLGIGICFLLFAVTITFIQVVIRNLFQFSFTWAEELTRYVVIFSVYFASGTIFYIDANAKVDIFYNLMPKKIRRILSCIFYFLIALFLCVMAYYGYIHVIRNAKIYCASIHIPWALPFMSLIIGAVNMLIQVPAKIYLVWCAF